MEVKWWMDVGIVQSANYTCCEPGASYTSREPLSMQINQKSVNNVKVPITDQADEKTDFNGTLSKSSLSFD